MKATIDRDGRITLGRDVQSKLGVQPGDEVILESRGKDLLIRAALNESGLAHEGNVVVHRGACATPADHSLAELQEERFEQLTEGLPR